MKIDNILFLSLESEPITLTFKELRLSGHPLSIIWKNYCRYIMNGGNGFTDETFEILWYDKAPFVPEFCKIKTIFLGIESGGELVQKELVGSEKEILTSLNKTFDKVSNKGSLIAGWNIKNYDLPLIHKRFYINKIIPNDVLPKYDTKPWEVKSFFDIKEFWNGSLSKGINTIDAFYYSFVNDADPSLIEDTFGGVNAKNKIIKMYQIMKELGDIN